MRPHLGGFVLILPFAFLSLAHLNPSSALSAPALFGNFVLFFATFHLAVLLHEGAHALVGRAVGLRVATVQTGFGRPIFQRIVAGTVIVVRTWPLHGATVLLPRSPRQARARLFAAILAAPLVSAASAFVCLRVAPLAPLLHGEVRTRLLPLPFFGAFCLLSAQSIFPFRLGGQQGSDGWRLWHIGTVDRRPETLADGTDEADAHLAAVRERWAEVRAVAERWLARTPDSISANAYLATAALYQREYAWARSTYQSLLDRVPALGRPLIQNNLAWACWMLRDPELLPEAASLSEKAVQACPFEPAFLGTRGAVLLELGRAAEAIPLLRRAAAAQPPRSRALNECCLAVATMRTGNRAAAERHVQNAARLDGACELLEWARRECAPDALHAYR